MVDFEVYRGKVKKHNIHARRILALAAQQLAAHNCVSNTVKDMATDWYVKDCELRASEARFTEKQGA